MTAAEWFDMDEDQPGELVDGVLVEEEVGDWVHELTLVWFARVVGAWAVARGGFAAGSKLKYVLRKDRGRKPDLSVVLPGSPAPPRRGPLRRPADVMIEIISPRPRDARRDRIEKLKDYAAFGVRWYWLVDPAMRTVEILELGADGRYVVAASADAGRLDAVPGCEGLVLDLDALWAELDRLGDAEPEEPG